jgi:hypothetical protein
VSVQLAVAPIRALAASTEQLFPPRTVHCRDVFGYSNAEGAALAQAKASMREMLAEVTSVDLVRLPPGARVLGGSWRLLVGDLLADEQLIYRAPGQLAEASLVPAPEGSVQQIDLEVVLIARYGDGTWGHWLGEMLPKVAACQALFPGRFHYALPAWALDAEPLGARMRESLYYYGVTPAQILPMDSDVEYRFSSLHAVTRVHQGRVLHPDVLTILRGADIADPRASPAVALLRYDPRRGIANLADTTTLLRKRGYQIINVALLDFPAQVELYKTARRLFTVLGSSLSGVIYAPPRVGIAAAAPAGFTDGFFTGLLRQNESAVFCSIDGPIAVENPRMKRDSSFTVPLGDLNLALDVVDAFAAPDFRQSHAA